MAAVFCGGLAFWTFGQRDRKVQAMGSDGDGGKKFIDMNDDPFSSNLDLKIAYFVVVYFYYLAREFGVDFALRKCTDLGLTLGELIYVAYMSVTE